MSKCYQISVLLNKMSKKFLQDRPLKQRRKQQKARTTLQNDPMMGFGTEKKLSKVVTVPPSPSKRQKKGDDLTVVLLPGEAYSSQVLLITTESTYS